MPFFDTPLRPEPVEDKGFHRPGEHAVGARLRHAVFNVVAVLVGLALLWWFVVVR